MKQRRAFVLPMILVFLFVGGALIAVTFDITNNSHEQSMQMITTGTLYNAAQSGLEWGKSQLLEHKEHLDRGTPRTFIAGVSDLSALHATYTPLGGTSTRVDEVLSGTAVKSLSINGITVRVRILDCNYTVSGTPSVSDELPPLRPSANDTGGTAGGSSPGFLNGTTAIMDPYRVTSSGSWGYPRHFYVIRSTATHEERTKTIETMVVING